MRAAKRAAPFAMDFQVVCLSGSVPFHSSLSLRGLFLSVDSSATVTMLPSALYCSCRCGAHWCSLFRGCCHLSSDLRGANLLVPDDPP